MCWSSPRNRCPDFVEVERAVLVDLQRIQLDAAECRGVGGLGAEDVRLLAEDDLFAAPAMGEQGNEVAHRATGDEERGFLAQH